MKIIRLSFYFLIGFLFSAWAVFSHAETVPATSNAVSTLTAAGIGQYSGYGLTDATFSGYCTKALAANGGYPKGSCPDLDPKTQPNREGYCGRYFANSYCSNSVAVYSETCPANYAMVGGVCKNNVVVYSCPTGQNWTLSGQSCTRPDCVAPQTRQADGTCSAPCPTYPGDASTPKDAPAGCACPSGTKWSSYEGCRKTCGTAGADANAGFDINIQKGASEGCFGGCGVQHKSGTFYTFKDGSTSAPATYTGWACAGNGTGTAPTADNQPAPDSPKLKDTDKKQPKCGAGEGVITSSSGNVLCVPPGTPNTSTPKVDTQKKTETYPDTTTKTTETTTTTDPYTGASDVRSTTTATGKADGTAGQAGPVGTSTSTGNSSTSKGTGAGSGSSDGEGNCDGNDCGGGKEWPKYDGLWAKKYPDGIGGVLTQKVTAIKASPLGGLVGQLAPNLPTTGACPSWSFAMNIGPHMNFGSSQLNMPCGVWSFVRIVLLITAALVARRLIFGG